MPQNTNHTTVKILVWGEKKSDMTVQGYLWNPVFNNLTATLSEDSNTCLDGVLAVTPKLQADGLWAE